MIIKIIIHEEMIFTVISSIFCMQMQSGTFGCIASVLVFVGVIDASILAASGIIGC